MGHVKSSTLSWFLDMSRLLFLCCKAGFGLLLSLFFTSRVEVHVVSVQEEEGEEGFAFGSGEYVGGTVSFTTVCDTLTN
jgi:hypothetical protein